MNIRDFIDQEKNPKEKLKLCEVYLCGFEDGFIETRHYDSHDWCYIDDLKTDLEKKLNWKRYTKLIRECLHLPAIVSPLDEYLNQNNFNEVLHVMSKLCLKDSLKKMNFSLPESITHDEIRKIIHYQMKSIKLLESDIMNYLKRMNINDSLYLLNYQPKHKYQSQRKNIYSYIGETFCSFDLVQASFSILRYVTNNVMDDWDGFWNKHIESEVPGQRLSFIHEYLRKNKIHRQIIVDHVIKNLDLRKLVDTIMKNAIGYFIDFFQVEPFIILEDEIIYKKDYESIDETKIDLFPIQFRKTIFTVLEKDDIGTKLKIHTYDSSYEVYKCFQPTVIANKVINLLLGHSYSTSCVILEEQA